MKEMLAEYGLIIVTSVCVLIFLAFATPLGELITGAIDDIVNDMVDTADAFFADVATPAASGSNGQ